MLIDDFCFVSIVSGFNKVDGIPTRCVTFTRHLVWTLSVKVTQPYNLTFPISGTIHVTAMPFFLFLRFFGSCNSMALSVALYKRTRDLELQGHATLQVTFAISGNIHVRAMIFFLFLQFFGSCNSMALSVTLYKQRVTLNFKVTRPYR